MNGPSALSGSTSCVVKPHGPSGTGRWTVILDDGRCAWQFKVCGSESKSIDDLFRALHCELCPCTLLSAEEVVLHTEQPVAEIHVRKVPQGTIREAEPEPGCCACHQAHLEALDCEAT